MIYLFSIGDKVVYPRQGIGIIDSMEKQEFCGELQTYYKIKFIDNSLEIMLPSSRLESANIRLLSDSSTLDHVLENIHEFAGDLNDLYGCSLKERMVKNSVKFNSGTLKDYIEVLCNLTEINKEHSLNSSEKQMLNNTKSFLIDEIRLVKDIPATKATNILNESISSIQ